MLSKLYKIFRYWHTLKYLKPPQFYWRIKNIIWKHKIQAIDGSENKFFKKKLIKGPSLNKTYIICKDEKICFDFLNNKKCFDLKNIDWEFEQFGKLWEYNLNYFEFLLQKDISLKLRTELLLSYCKTISNRKTGLEPYPTSLRLMNALKFLNSLDTIPDILSQSLFRQAELLTKRIEYHLLGNHLLENGFALLCAGIFYNNEVFKKRGFSILRTELEEQILSDGGHFELSTMYHQHILYRVLESINFLFDSKDKDEIRFKLFLIEKAKMMLSWINQMTYANGENPCFNDTAKGIAPTTSLLNTYSKCLNIQNNKLIPLGESGYKWFNNAEAELVIDVGKIGPDYQLGHAHADTLSFELALFGQRVFVNSGTSEYGNSFKRSFQRSTKAHNTVVVDDQNSSDVWGGFRVGKRIHSVNLSEIKSEKDGISIKGEHRGYSKKFKPIIHYRKWELKEGYCILTDLISGEFKKAEANFYLHPNIQLKTQYDGCYELILPSKEKVLIIFKNYQKIKIQKSYWFPEFGLEIPSNLIEVIFGDESLITSIFWSYS